MLGQEYTENC